MSQLLQGLTRSQFLLGQTASILIECIICCNALHTRCANYKEGMMAQSILHNISINMSHFSRINSENAKYMQMRSVHNTMMAYFFARDDGAIFYLILSNYYLKQNWVGSLTIHIICLSLPDSCVQAYTNKAVSFIFLQNFYTHCFSKSFSIKN